MWRTFKSKYAGTCKRCGHEFEAGTVIVWNTRTRYVAHRDCGNPDRLLERDALRVRMEEESRAFQQAMRGAPRYRQENGQWVRIEE